MDSKYDRNLSEPNNYVGLKTTVALLAVLKQYFEMKFLNRFRQTKAFVSTNNSTVRCLEVLSKCHLDIDITQELDISWNLNNDKTLFTITKS